MSKFDKDFFEQANEFILPETSLYDFFDYLNGEKLYFSEDKAACEQNTIVFKYACNIPKPNYSKYPRVPIKEDYKPIKLKPVGSLNNTESNFKFKNGQK